MTGRRLSLSEMRQFRRCRRTWWLGYNQGQLLRYPELVGARSLGNVVHAALEAYYRPGYERDGTVALEQVQLLRAQDIGLLNAAALENAPGAAEQLSKATAQYDLAFTMVEGYLDWAATEGIDAHMEVLGVEENLEVPVTLESGAQFTFAGRADQLCRWTDTGTIRIRDYKTVANLTDLPKLAGINEQALHYWWLLDQLQLAPRIDGVEFVMLRKVKRTARSTPPFYGAHRVSLNRHQLGAWARRLMGIAEEIAAVERRLVAGEDPMVVCFPNPMSTCSWDCDHLALCPMMDDGSRWEDAAAAFYRVGDPYARYNAITPDAREEQT